MHDFAQSGSYVEFGPQETPTGPIVGPRERYLWRPVRGSYERRSDVRVDGDENLGSSGFRVGSLGGGIGA